MRGSEVRILSAAPLSPTEHCPPTRHAWVGGSNPLRGTIIASRALSTHSSCVGRKFESSPRHHYRQQSTVHPHAMGGGSNPLRGTSFPKSSPVENCPPTGHA